MYVHSYGCIDEDPGLITPVSGPASLPGTLSVRTTAMTASHGHQVIAQAWVSSRLSIRLRRLPAESTRLRYARGAQVISGNFSLAQTGSAAGGR